MPFSKKQIRTAIRQALLVYELGDNRPKFVKILDIHFSEVLQELEVRFTTSVLCGMHYIRFFDARNLSTKTKFKMEGKLTDYATKLIG